MSFDTPVPPYNASDPHATFLNSSCLDLLLIELVPMAHRLAQEVATGSASASAMPHPRGADGQAAAGSGAGGAAGGGPGVGGGGGGGPGPGQGEGKSSAGAAGTTGGGAQVAGSGSMSDSVSGSAPTVTGKAGGPGLEDDETREAMFFRLEALGYRVGQGLAERFTRERPRFTDTLDVIKFLCKDLWTLVFRKQVDNLKTNHRGIYVLTDNTFRPLIRMSTEAGGQAVLRAQPFLWFPCGIIRGALVSFGIHATVQAETAELPGATFQIKTAGARV